jgi:hypothetical protein
MPSTRNQPRAAATDPDANKTALGKLASCRPYVDGGDFIDQTIAIWQNRTDRRLTREDGREIIENITGFFTILQEWERKERTAGDAKTALSAPGSHVMRRTRRTKDEAETSLSSKPVRAKI